MATSMEFTEEQLSAARTALWHQNGEALVTLEAAQDFLEHFGLVAFAQGKLPMTAPSLVEATLGAANPAPTAAASQTARELVSRMAGDGSALPLNLTGGGGDTPDFVVSGSALKYVFTLRGDKNWKKAPETSGAAKVSPLSLRVYETLVESKAAMTAAELASELGREVTEAAIVRALGELWQGLRVIPLAGLGDNATLWELTSRRFTRAIKAGMNAGQPTALSALISLYLQQALVATEEEIETFLSPLAARSRVREVLHALRGARELNEVVVNGKTLLHVAGELPEFAPLATGEAEVEGEEAAADAPEGDEAGEAPSRIKTFTGKKTYAERSPYAKKAADAERTAAKREPYTREGGKVAFKRTGAAKPFGDKKPFGAKRTFGDKPAFGAKKPFGAKRSFGDKPSFTKPWDEEKKPRRSAEGGDEAPASFSKFRKPAPAPGRATLRAEKFAGRPTWDGPSKPREEAGERTSFDRPKRAYAPREGGSSFDRPKRPYTPRGEGKPFDGPKRPYVKREGSFDGPKRPYVKREGGSFDGPKKPFRPRTEGGSFDREKRPYTPRGEGRTFDGPKRPFVKREGSSFDGPKKPFRPRGDKPFDGPKRPYTPREGAAFDRPKRSFAPREGGEGDRPKRPFTPREGGDRKPFGARKPFGDRPKFGGDHEGGNFRPKRTAKPGGKKPFGAGKLFDKKGPLPADGEGGLSPTGSKRKRRTEE